MSWAATSTGWDSPHAPAAWSARLTAPATIHATAAAATRTATHQRRGWRRSATNGRRRDRDAGRARRASGFGRMGAPPRAGWLCEGEADRDASGDLLERGRGSSGGGAGGGRRAARVGGAALAVRIGARGARRVGLGRRLRRAAGARCRLRGRRGAAHVVLVEADSLERYSEPPSPLHKD